MPLNHVDLTKTLEPLSWCVEDLFLEGYISTVASLPGEGKTALLTSLVWQLSRPNGTFLSRSLKQSCSIYLDFDAPGDGRSLHYWFTKHKQSFPDGDLNKIKVLEPDIETYSFGEAEFEALMTLALGFNARLILIDSFSSAFPRVDPNKLTQVQGPLWYLRRLATETKAAVIVLDHLPKPLSGERAGSRGVLGSIAKSAQARAVHLLSRVETNASKTLLRWDVSKLSFAARPKPFAVKLEIDSGVQISLADLPPGHGETKTKRALRAVQNHLEASRGKLSYHGELLEIAMHKGDIGKRAATDVMRLTKEHYGHELKTHVLPGRGKPQGYVLSETSASLPQTPKTSAATEKHLKHTGVPQIVRPAQKEIKPRHAPTAQKA